MAKIYCSNNEQIRKLKSRGMTISSLSKTKRIIEYGNYFVIINGYKELFIDPTYIGSDERYLPGTTFEEVYSLYCFDRKLRSLFLRNILLIENSVKSIISRVFSSKYGHDNYLLIANFDTSVRPGQKQTKSQIVSDVIRLISQIQADISKQLEKQNPMIVHYQLDHGYIPLWVLVNILSLGTISIFYSHMHQADQNDVGRKFNLKPNELQSVLNTLTLYRNVCAHDGRFFNYKNHRRLVIMPIHKSLSIPKAGQSGNLAYGQKDLFSILIIFRLMLKRNDFRVFFKELDALIHELDSNLHTISISSVLNSMGFPANWRDIRKV